MRAPNTTAPEEIATVRRQLEEINPKEEFAKYARLKRQLDKLKDDYKAEGEDGVKFCPECIIPTMALYIKLSVSLLVFCFGSSTDDSR